LISRGGEQSPDTVALPSGTWVDVDSSGDVSYNVFELPWELRLLSEASAVAAALTVAVAAFLAWRILRSRAAPGRFAEPPGWRPWALVTVPVVGALLTQRLGKDTPGQSA
jgi:hypothetical protein